MNVILERKLRKLILKSMPLETDRLIIRYVNKNDALDMYEYASKEEVCRYLLWSPHINLSATEGYIDFLCDRYKKGLYADWAVVLKSNGKMIGTCGFASLNSAEGKSEIGYVLSPDFQGNGYMTEAVKAVLRLNFEVLKLNSAHLRIIRENHASIKLAERLGFKEIGCTVLIIKGIEREVLNFVMTIEDFEKIKKEAVD